eukprot:CAMPEP_0185568828 /NCGR_PEP_ID=MMETSP0434-20130131/1667_1 /TAXON_ID=626734 ORGANISM="Favella taraikaensis, Strain Fe Narragansett Bay" /NCGR_SAMPLE_ID=MMETSP0434 /ASSEMBLY_ACC=CAM_ASM_000379 /LENGTH=196 /DNA_ID=CAMNT_0028183451 /DNA_START=169 /DNA_END=756 /DNA_ORIENTATION=+
MPDDSLLSYCLRSSFFELSGSFLWADILAVDIIVSISLDACAADEDEEDSAEEQADEHDVAPEAAIAHQKHRRHEQVEDSFTNHRLQELEVRRDKLQLAKGDHQQCAEEHLIEFENENHDCTAGNLDVEHVENSRNDHDSTDGHLGDLDPCAKSDAATRLVLFFGGHPKLEAKPTAVATGAAGAVAARDFAPWRLE